MAPSAKEAALIPDEYKFSFTVEGQTYHLYTHSYLGYGVEQVGTMTSARPLSPSLPPSLPLPL